MFTGLHLPGNLGVFPMNADMFTTVRVYFLHLQNGKCW